MDAYLPNASDRELIDLARAARANAHAPYSHCAVGAAVRDEQGRAFAGCNVENASYGATLCAERVAVGAAVAAGAKRLVALAVVTPNGGMPCGVCRQVLSEFAPAELRVWAAAEDPEVPPRRTTLGQLLPDAWGAADLEGA